ncbi:MAG: hypothetical protein HDKAJFGB_00919 [Anaerolineae bacterium]|nr:hypothetical protein [Anaerolineae bacterium]
MKPRANPLYIVQNALNAAQRDESAKHKRVAEAGLSPQVAELRAFQVKRIRETYRDFAAQKQYAATLDFFTNDLYAPRDFSQRNHDAQRVHAFLQKFLPAEMLKLAADAIALTQLSDALDEKLATILQQDLAFQNNLTPALYAEAYRRSKNVRAREQQIDLLVTVMQDSADTARMPLTGVALKLAKGPAHAAGWHELYAFLERGYHAFAQVKQPERFLEAIEDRENEIMRRILAGAAAPFRI